MQKRLDTYPSVFASSARMVNAICDINWCFLHDKGTIEMEDKPFFVK